MGNETRPQRGFDHWVNTEDSYVRNHELEGDSSCYHFLVSQGYTPLDRHTAARLPEEMGKPAYQTAQTIRFLERHGDQPFFLSVNFSEPHSPFTGPFDGLYDPGEMILPASWYGHMEETVPLQLKRLREAYSRGYMAEGQIGIKSDDEASWKELKSRYWGLCTLIDKYIGRILTSLEELGLAESTIVVFTSDHGHMMGEHRLLNKSVLYEASSRIPLILRVPGSAPRRLATPVRHVDLVSTLMELVGHAQPEHLHGTSLAPLISGGDQSPEDTEMIIEWSGLAATELVNAARFLGQPTTNSHAAVRTIQGGQWKLNVSSSGEHELYDLKSDVGELHDSFRDPGTRDTVLELYRKLLSWQRDTSDKMALPRLYDE